MVPASWSLQLLHWLQICIIWWIMKMTTLTELGSYFIWPHMWKRTYGSRHIKMETWYWISIKNPYNEFHSHKCVSLTKTNNKNKAVNSCLEFLDNCHVSQWYVKWNLSPFTAPMKRAPYLFSQMYGSKRTTFSPRWFWFDYLSSNKLEFTLIGIYQTQIFPVPIIIFTEKKKKKKKGFQITWTMLLEFGNLNPRKKFLVIELSYNGKMKVSRHFKIAKTQERNILFML
jgi:hypothetical protein